MTDRIDEMEAAWNTLIATVADAPEGDVAGKRDPAGWTALDHLAHVSAWERTALFPMLGRPRHEGAGVTADEFALEFDPLNEIIRGQTAGQPRQQVIDDANRWHRQLVETMRNATPGELQKTAREFDPDGRDATDPRSILDIAEGNTTGHYLEHDGYIRKILAS